MKVRRKFFWGALVLLGVPALLLGTAQFYYMGYEPGRGQYPVQGVDISHHQGLIDWDRVKDGGLDFVYMKATEGGDFKDPRFQENWLEAGRVGIRRGAYHYFTLCRPGAEQVRNFLDTVPLTPDTLPPAVDLEFDGNCASRPAKEALHHELQIFLDALERRYGTKPLLYLTKSFYQFYLAGEFKQYPPWQRALLLEPAFTDRSWTFWQFHNQGRRKGINGPVDLNLFRHGHKSFEGLFQSRGRSELAPG